MLKSLTIFHLKRRHKTCWTLGWMFLTSCSPVQFRPSRARRKPWKASRRSAAGFTLIELMVVVIIISIVAVAAIPSMLTAQQERRTFQGAADFAALFREGRSRAAGRGVPVQIALTNISGQATGVLREAPSKADPATMALAQGGCAGTNWAGLPVLERTEIAGGVYAENSTVVTMVAQGNPVQTATICFTPGGRVFMSTVNGLGADQANGGVVELIITREPNNIVTGITRRVILPTTGAPRIISQ
jgi:type II secretion system protein H